jgi:hypothetical protein
MSTEWEIVELMWAEESGKAQQGAPPQKRAADNNKLGTQLNALDAYLQSARKKLQKDPASATTILQETKVRR